MRLSLCQLDKLVIVAVRREQEDVDVDGGFLQEESQCRFDFQYLLVRISVISSFRIDTGGVDLFRTLVILALNVIEGEEEAEDVGDGLFPLVSEVLVISVFRITGLRWSHVT